MNRAEVFLSGNPANDLDCEVYFSHLFVKKSV
jgi:hypothetical protein